MLLQGAELKLKNNWDSKGPIANNSKCWNRGRISDKN